MKIVAITPVYNEEKVIIDVLERIKKHVDILIISNDGSTDSTPKLIDAWRQGRQGIFVISARRNGGASMALKKGYALVTHLVSKGDLALDDAVIEIDSDGQHDPDYMPKLVERYVEHGGRKVVLARRDFSNYPFVKVWGNRFLTLVASVLGGKRYYDVESNYRVMPAQSFAKLLQYFWGYRYSGAFEVGIILARLGFETDNTLVVQVPYYRAGSRPIDGFHVIAAGFLAWARVLMRRRRCDVYDITREVLTELA